MKTRYLFALLHVRVTGSAPLDRDKNIVIEEHAASIKLQQDEITLPGHES